MTTRTGFAAAVKASHHWWITTDGAMKQSQQIGFLKKIAFFYDFDDHELKQFLQVSKWLKVVKNTLIIRENTYERAFYILVKGKMGVFKTGAGDKDVPLTTLSAGDCFGEMALVSDIRRTANVKALEESYILRVEPEIISTSNVFLQLKFYKRFCEIMVARLDLANRQVAKTGAPASTVIDINKYVLEQDKAAMNKSAAAQAVERKSSGDEHVGQAEVVSSAGEKPELALPPMPDPEKRLSLTKLRRRLGFEDVIIVNPFVAEAVSKVCSQGNLEENTRTLAAVISLDPVLSCRLLQAANSPFYKRVNNVATVAHAVLVVGIGNVKKLMTETLELAKDKAAFKGYPSLAPLFWQHGVVVGRIAQLLAESIGISSGSDLYLAGLMHDLGMLAVDTVAPGFYPQLQRGDCPFRSDLAEAEKEYVGIDHGQAGGWLGENIGLAPVYMEVMRNHHTPAKAASHRLTVALIALANQIANERGVSLSGGAGSQGAALEEAAAWLLIQDNHQPFAQVSIASFVAHFNLELNKCWQDIVAMDV